MKCCPDCKIVYKKSHLRHGGFLFPYRLDYCSSCGKVKSTTIIHDGKEVDNDWEVV